MSSLTSSLFVFLSLTCSLLAGAEWPEFRGPSGDGHAAAPAGLPLRWSETENIRWKTPIPERGWSTPVVLGGQVWLTTATVDGHDFFAVCVDAESGQILFNEKLFHADKPEPLNNNVNCYASPTPVIEPGRVYISFGSYGTACLDTATRKVLWERRDLPCRHYRGPGSSPILFEDLLILTMDGVDVQYVVALDKKSGKTVWKTDRTTDFKDLDAQGKPMTEGDYRKAFSTPLIVDVNGKTEMLSAGSRGAYAYDPRTGREIWKVSHPGYSSAARPVYGQGLAFIMTGQGQPGLIVVRADGEGDVSKTHVVWKTNQGAPKLPSPLLADNLLYMVSDDGGVTCLEPATGNVVWKERIGGQYCASPIYAEERIYIPSTQGKTTVLKAGRHFELLATNTLDAGCMASPAVSGKALFLRTKTHLYRIGAETKGAEGGSPAGEEIEALKNDIAQIRGQKEKERKRLLALGLEDLSRALREPLKSYGDSFEIRKILLPKIKLGTPREEVRRLAGEPDKIVDGNDCYRDQFTTLPGGCRLLLVSYKDGKVSGLFKSCDYSIYRERGMKAPPDWKEAVPLEGGGK